MAVERSACNSGHDVDRRAIKLKLSSALSPTCILKLLDRFDIPMAVALRTNPDLIYLPDHGFVGPDGGVPSSPLDSLLRLIQP